MAPPQTPVTSALSRPGITAFPRECDFEDHCCSCDWSGECLCLCCLPILIAVSRSLLGVASRSPPLVPVWITKQRSPVVCWMGHMLSTHSAYGLRRPATNRILTPVQSCLPNLHPPTQCSLSSPSSA